MSIFYSFSSIFMYDVHEGLLFCRLFQFILTKNKFNPNGDIPLTTEEIMSDVSVRSVTKINLTTPCVRLKA